MSTPGYICQLYFISGKPSRFPSSPDYVPLQFCYKSALADSEASNNARYERLQARRRKQLSYRSENLKE